MEYFGDNYYLVDGKFWEAFEFFYKLKLPVYLKNVLSVNGYGCISTFCKITGSCFEAIEETIRSFHQCEQKGTVDTLHLYRDAPALFKIVPGHRELLLEYSVKLASQQNEFNEVLASRLSMEISPQPQLMSASSTVNSREYQNPSSHMRIINQLITTKLEVPKNVHLNIRIVDDNSAKISCFQCEQEVDIKTKILSATNRHWMIGKYIKHIEMHSKLDQPPQGSSQDRSLPEDSDSENEIELSDEMDRRVLELKYRQKTLRSSSNFSMTRSLKRNIKMTTEVAHDVKQRKITRYFSSATTKQSEDVKYSPRDSIQDDNKLFLGLLEKLPLTNMMKTMIRETITNGYKNIITAKSEAKGARYTTESKNIGAYFYLMGGKKDYEELVVNLGLPSLSTILRHIRKSCNKIVEGQLRIGKLLEFLEARNLPKIVFISEDGTKISPRVRYDIASDQIAGLCPRLDSNGIPEIGSFPAKTPELIKNHMEMNPKSTMVYVVLATPMTTKTLSFNLLSFGTNNKFSIDEVLLRWGIMEKEMEKKGITIIGYGADGDSRLIGSMKIRMGLPRTIELFEIPSNWDSWYAAKGQTGVVYVQDSTHIVNKLKNCLLSYTRNLQIGKYAASRGHLEMVAKDGKEHTGLLESDLEQMDKMSVKTFHKLIDPRVPLWLKKYPGTNGTIAYINLMDAVYKSYENDSLSPLERIEEIWFATFFIRVWHHWIKEHKRLRLDENFITDNAELGIEINAHSLINYLMFCRQLNKPELFLPTLLHSQHNERSFANARSMTGVQNTVINFDILEYLNKATRFEFLDELRMMLEGKFSFARGNFKKTEYANFTFPMDDDIYFAVEKGKMRAKQLLDHNGLEWEEKDFECVVSYSNRYEILPLNEINVEEDMDFEIDEVRHAREDEDLIFEANTLLNQTGSDFSKICKHVPGDLTTPRGFFKILTSTGEVMLARKGTVVWLLSSERTKISNDRLMRFRTPTNQEVRSVSFDDQLNSNEARLYISVGDWFIFEENRKFVTAQVLGFVYLDGKLKREKECSLKTIPVEVPTHVSSPKGVGIVCNKFQISSSKKLSIISDWSKINIDRYVSHIQKPVLIGDNSFGITEETVKYLETL